MDVFLDVNNNENALRKELGMVRSKLQDEEKKTQKLSSDLKNLKNEVCDVDYSFLIFLNFEVTQKKNGSLVQ